MWTRRYARFGSLASLSTISAYSSQPSLCESSPFEPKLVGITQVASNDPVEDRYTVDRIDKIDALWFAVFDGHSVRFFFFFFFGRIDPVTPIDCVALS